MEIDKKIYRIFGRTRGRKNNKSKIDKYFKLVSQYKFNKLDEKEKYILDIGTGYGETTIYFARKYYNYKIIACDKYIDGNLNLLKNIQLQKINNIYIHNGNVHEILDFNIKKNYFDIVSIFFPDPWPKKKHNKRRLITVSFLKKISSYMYENGKLVIVSDSISYSRQILRCIYDTRETFNWLNQSKLELSIKDFFNIETKFYKKAIISQRKPVLFILQKL